MITHILVPLDGSGLAECILPHVIATATAFNARVTLLHVMESPHEKGNIQAVDPLEWQLKKREAEVYLECIAARLRDAGLTVQEIIQEGQPADSIIDFAKNNNVDLIALSTHGRSGLSEWNVSSVVQKIILRSYKSILLARAYKSSASSAKIKYLRIFVGLDCSARAEYILPSAITLAKYYQAQLILGTIIPKPEMSHRFPLSDDDADLIKRITERNQQAAAHYFEQLQSQLSLQGINLKTRMDVNEHIASALYDMVEAEGADMVMLVAHGYSGMGRWPFGSVATSFIAFGNTALMIKQDLTTDEIKGPYTEEPAKETKGR